MMKNKQVSITDEQLVNLIMQGDQSAMSQLYLRYYMIVYNRCLSFSKNMDDASDLTQDIMLRVIEKIDSFHGTSKFSTWLYSITFNYCTDQLRKNKHRQIESLDNHCNLQDESDLELNTLKELERKSARADQVLMSIPAEDQQILLMKYQHNKSIKELQELYDLSASAVKMRLMRAKAKAATMLKVQHAA